MSAIALEKGQLLMSTDFMDWEVIDGDVPREVAWEWLSDVGSRTTIKMIAPTAPTDYLREQMRSGSCGFHMIHKDWTNYAGVVVLVPTRDMKMALAIRRVDDKFQLLGRRGG